MPWTWSKYDRAGLARYISSKAAQFVLPLNSPNSTNNRDHRKSLVQAIYWELANQKLGYRYELYDPDQAIQQIRTPEEVLKLFREGTCLDLALLFAGICFHYELLTLIIILDGHAYIAISLTHSLREWDSLTRRDYTLFSAGPLEDPALLHSLIAAGDYLPIECIGVASHLSAGSSPVLGPLSSRVNLSFEEACGISMDNLKIPSVPFLYALDSSVARYLWKISEEALTTAQLPAPLVYAETFIRQFENWALRTSETPITDAIFRADLQSTYISAGYVDSRGLYSECLDDFLLSWSGQSDLRYLAVLGDYGTGKTSAFLQLTYKLLCRCRRTFYQSPLPLYLTFRDLHGTRPVAEEFLRLLNERYHIRLQSMLDFQEFAAQYQVILILDGLDEIIPSLDSSIIKKKLNEISALTVACKKTLISSRTTFFPSRTDLEYVLPMQAAEIDLLETYIPDCTFEIVFVADLDPNKQEAYLVKVANSPAEARRLSILIQSTYSLAQLSKRPILLRMIQKSLSLSRNYERLELSPASLYDRYINAYLEKEFLEKESDIPVKIKRWMLCEIAVALYRENKATIRRGELMTFIRDVSVGRQEGSVSFDKVEYDFIACSLLTVNADGVFAFSHRSFLEFFIAEALLEDIQREARRTMSAIILTPVIVKFLCDLCRARNLLPTAMKALERWLGQIRIPSVSLVLYKNVIAILSGLGFSFGSRDLSNVDLAYLDLSTGNFCRCNLGGADLSGCNLSFADFSQATLSHSSLQNAFLNGTIFRGADLRNADFWNIRMIDGPTTVLIAGFIPHSNLVAIGTSNGDLVICDDRKSMEIRAQVRVATTGILHFAFSPDGRSLAVSDRASRIYLFKSDTLIAGSNQPTAVIGDQTDNVRWLEFSPTGTQLACGARDSTVRIWTFGVRNQLTELRFHRGPVMCVRWSPSGHLIATAGYDRMVYLLSPSGGDPIPLQEEGQESTHNGIVRTLAFNGDGSILATAAEDSLIKLWTVDPSGHNHYLKTIFIGEPVFTLCFTEESILAFGTSAGCVGIANIISGAIIHTVTGHEDIVRSMEVKENLLLTGSWDGTTRLWQKELLHLQSDLYRVPTKSEPAKDLFAGALITGLKGLASHWIIYFKSLGAIYE